MLFFWGRKVMRGSMIKKHIQFHFFKSLRNFVPPLKRKGRDGGVSGSDRNSGGVFFYLMDDRPARK